MVEEALINFNASSTAHPKKNILVSEVRRLIGRFFLLCGYCAFFPS
jgi:hypothetical protein